MRCGKGNKDRRTLMPARLAAPLQRQLEEMQKGRAQMEQERQDAYNELHASKARLASLE